MPCMYNGKPVKGTKGACPLNSTWVEDGQSAPSSDKNQLFADSRTFGDWFDSANYDKFKYKRGTVTQAMDDFFDKMGYTPPGWKPLSTRPKPPASFISPNAQRRETFDAGINPMTGRKPPVKKDMSMMQKLGANMKNPEWWSESISGLPSDTRLMRLGQLMNYYGKTPKGRQASDDPSKLWAANEAASAKIQATKNAAKAKSAVELYGKKTIADLTTELIPDVKEMFGDRRWTRLTDNPEESDEEAMASIAGQVATNIKAMSLAFPNKTPGDIRKMALAKVAEDRDLDVY